MREAIDHDRAEPVRRTHASGQRLPGVPSDPRRRDARHRRPVGGRAAHQRRLGRRDGRPSPSAVPAAARARGRRRVPRGARAGPFRSPPMGEGLRSDAADPVGPWAAFIGRPYYWQAWSHLLHSVRTGENAFRHVHGTDVWEYRARHPEEGAIFDRAMTGLSRRRRRRRLCGLRLLPLRPRRRRRRRARGAPGRDPGGASRRCAASSSTSRTSSAGAGGCCGGGVGGPLRGGRRQLLRGGARRAATPTCSRRSCTTGTTSRSIAILRTCRRAMAAGSSAAGAGARDCAAQRGPGRQVRRPQHAGRAGRAGTHRATNSPPSSPPPAFVRRRLSRQGRGSA